MHAWGTTDDPDDRQADPGTAVEETREQPGADITQQQLRQRCPGAKEDSGQQRGLNAAVRQGSSHLTDCPMVSLRHP
ncbi:hypothetical protein GCM10025780_05480 [Frondihabitans cladoniiphilus]|uniref:Uncharacterized protein n=1 Tax=Frondihabitans cladoniiphilus TaxID=715785 RepID=A0ABP8VM69_9MICO